MDWESRPDGDEYTNGNGNANDDDDDEEFGDDFDDFAEGDEDADFGDFDDGFQQAEATNSTPVPQPQIQTASFVRIPHPPFCHYYSSSHKR
jgi:hypothetical protein